MKEQNSSLLPKDEAVQDIEHLYKEAKQSSEERFALLSISRVLSSPDALRDPQSVYETIYTQVRQIMPVDAFFISRYNSQYNMLHMEYLIDEGISYPPIEYAPPISQRREFLVGKTVGMRFCTQQEYAAFTKDDQKDVPQENDLLGTKKLSESLLFISLRHGEELIGILSVQSYQPYAYTERHLYVLEEIGLQAAMAITNARLHAHLRDAVKQAQISEQLTNYFLMTAAHELRTPLTAIHGYLELLSTNYPDFNEETKKRFIAQAYRASEELILLIGNVMDTSHLDQDKVSLQLGAVSVQQTVQLIQEIFAPALENEHRILEVTLAKNLFVWADELRLRQILSNIVSNALKYTPSLTRIAIEAKRVSWETLHIRIPHEGETDIDMQSVFVLIAIRDWGDGIARQDQTHLFNKFVRLSKAMNSTQRGSGLGLYVCRQLIEAMKGFIWVESTGIGGEGATFFLALPCWVSSSAQEDGDAA